MNAEERLSDVANALAWIDASGNRFRTFQLRVRAKCPLVSAICGDITVFAVES